MNEDYKMDQRIFSLLHKIEPSNEKQTIFFLSRKKMAWYDNEQILNKAK